MPYVNPDEQAKYQARRHKRERENWRYRIGHLLNHAKRRARTKRLALDLTHEHLTHILEIQAYKCAVTGIEMTLDVPGRNKPHPYGPSIDRIDPTRGYTWDNVRVVCTTYNTAKGIHTDEHIRVLAYHILNPKQD